MKNTYQLFIQLTTLSLLISCSLAEQEKFDKVKDNIIKLPINFMELKIISADSIFVKAKTGGSNLTIINHGWIWKPLSNIPPDLNTDPKTSYGKLTADSFQNKIDKFAYDITYIIWPYIVLANDSVCFGTSKTFKMDLPVFSDIQPVLDLACKASFKVDLIYPIQCPPVKYGVIYDTIKDPKNGIKVESFGLNNNSFSVDLSGLMQNTQYYIWAYAENMEGTTVLSKELPYKTQRSFFDNLQAQINTDQTIFKNAIVKLTGDVTGEANFTWVFPDGARDTHKVTTYHFLEKGEFKIKLNAENGGCKATKTIDFNVIEDPFSNYWVFVEAGTTFMMGCTISTGCNPPPVTVRLDTSYYIGKSEITQAQWFTITQNYPSNFSCDTCPVENVSWDDIDKKFLPGLFKKTGKYHRLPTEAEWEFAARGGRLSRNKRYAGSDIVNDVAWYQLNSAMTDTVCTKMPNELEICDMSGNVFELCNDWYIDYPTGQTLINPFGPINGSFRVLRGGSYKSLPASLTVFRRLPQDPKLKSPEIGFRIISRNP